MNGGTQQAARIMASVEAQYAPFRTVPLPVDVSDAEAFPEIARAIAHARKMKEARYG